MLNDEGSRRREERRNTRQAEKAVFGFTGLTHPTLYCLATNDDVSTIT